MNRGHIQAERAASAQRDLFDTQLRIEDQLIEQKSEPHHPLSRMKAGQVLHLAAPSFDLSIAGIRSAYQSKDGTVTVDCDDTRNNARVNFHSDMDIAALGVDGIAERLDRMERTGPTVRSLTDTFNNKL